jgi:hypothetical protein
MFGQQSETRFGEIFIASELESKIIARGFDEI